MERRPYFIFGDILACIATGAAAGWIVHAALPADWFAPVGMVLGMALGMLIGLAGGFLFGPLFGDLETTLPAGLSGMVAGSLAGMLQGMVEFGSATALLGGALAGLACLAYTYAWQARLRGEAK